MKNANYQRVLIYANATNDLGVIVAGMGKEYNELKVASMIATLGRKGSISAEKASALLANHPNVAKSLAFPSGAKMVGELPEQKLGEKTVYAAPEFVPTVKKVVKSNLTDKEEAVMNIIRKAAGAVRAEDISLADKSISVASARIVLANLEKKKGMLSLSEARIKGKAIKSYTINAQ